MTHIEFLGPPGVGKSTVFSKLITNDTFYGGTEDDAVRRMFLEKAELKYQLPYRVTPSILRGFFETKLIQPRFRRRVLEDFIRNYPNFIINLSNAMDLVSHEPEKVFSYCIRSAEKYQLGISTVSEQEMLCIDEGFAQKAFAILWREPSESFSLKRYFDSVPTPELVIHVDAPVDLCLERQRERGIVSVARDWESTDPKVTQKKVRRLCLNIRDYLENETSVLTVENTFTVEKVVEQILEAHSEVMDS